MSIYQYHDSARPLNLEEFPPEIVILILSHVDPLTLAKLPLVCKQWHTILNNDMVWHEIFRIQYPHKPVFPTITRSKFYRTELLHRTSVRHEYKRGKLLNTFFSLKNTGWSHTISVDWNRNKLISIDVDRDLITSCDISNGKMTNQFSKFIPDDFNFYDAGYKSCNVYGTRAIVYGAGDGAVSGSIVDWKGLLISDVKKWGNMDNEHITAVCACITANDNMKKDYERSIPSIASLTTSKVVKKKVLVIDDNSGIRLSNKSNNKTTQNKPNSTILHKAGQIGALSANEVGDIWGWDIRTGDVLCKLHIPGYSKSEINYKVIIKLFSDSKTVILAISQTGEIWSIRNVFRLLKGEDVEVKYRKIGRVGIVDTGSFLQHMFVDYGNETISVWNDYEFVVMSYSDDEDCPTPVFYIRPEGRFISLVSFEANSKPFTKRDESIIGCDPLYAAIVLDNGDVEVINIRESQCETLAPVHDKPIQPKFLKEFYRWNRYEVTEEMGPVAAVALTSMVMAVSSHEGKVELYDLMSGDYLRTATDKLSNKRLIDIQLAQPERSRNNLTQISLDQDQARGLVAVGPFIQYFTLGENERNIRRETARKNKSWKKIGKASYSEEINFHLDNYQVETESKKKDKVLINKYNGSHKLSEAEELELVTSMSLDASGTETQATVDDLELALKLSLFDGKDEFEDVHQELDEDEQLRIALDLSTQDNYKNWEGDEYDEDFEERWESILD